MQERWVVVTGQYSVVFLCLFVPLCVPLCSVCLSVSPAGSVSAVGDRQRSSFPALLRSHESVFSTGHRLNQPDRPLRLRSLQ